MRRRTAIQQAVGTKGLAIPLGKGRKPTERLSGIRSGPALERKESNRIAKAIQPALGKQLSGRVASGAITQSQGRRTAKQRDLLNAAFGEDWRTKVFGQGGAKGLSGPFATSQARTKRVKALERARVKVRGSGGAAAR